MNKYHMEISLLEGVIQKAISERLGDKGMICLYSSDNKKPVFAVTNPEPWMLDISIADLVAFFCKCNGLSVAETIRQLEKYAEELKSES